ncbi:DUF2884 family protein [Xanthomonas theicola]|uniref:DUF2884 domain-containing protein n=1 Tax=Xanthomonas theicola TaxID=56464 RepID=A0A2S6ZHD1_9XANT|nr:DUF2884 family protein [Xanthomonas theicola]PPT91540.1 DUF2884 domain-containing protein [Xanthomonas theicola]QNH25082.1 YggN family protein [Xanthomonas theicola]
MQHRSLALAGIALTALSALAACQPSTPQADKTGSADSGGKHSLSLDNGDITLTVSGQPPATITRTGDLLIDGKQIAVSAEQHALLVAYREQLGAIGTQGQEVGKQGAALGVKAAGDALAGVISGNTDHVGENIEAQAEKLKQEALKICEQVAALRQAQDTLAQQLPTFRPYASLDASDISDCDTSVK